MPSSLIQIRFFPFPIAFPQLHTNYRCYSFNLVLCCQSLTILDHIVIILFTLTHPVLYICLNSNEQGYYSLQSLYMKSLDLVSIKVST